MLPQTIRALGSCPHWPRWRRGRFVHQACQKLQGLSVPKASKEKKALSNLSLQELSAWALQREMVLRWESPIFPGHVTPDKPLFLLHQHLPHEFGFCCGRQPNLHFQVYKKYTKIQFIHTSTINLIAQVLLKTISSTQKYSMNFWQSWKSNLMKEEQPINKHTVEQVDIHWQKKWTLI